MIAGPVRRDFPSYIKTHQSILLKVTAAAILLIRFATQTIVYRSGFISVSADEFSRGIRAVNWAQHPVFDLFSGQYGAWLPFEKYLNGLLLLVWPDPYWAPRATVFLASLLLLLAIFQLTRLLFENKAVALLSLLLISFMPWYIWLGGTPMLELYYLACYFAGLALLVAWLERQNQRAYLASILALVCATGFHVQSWLVVNLTLLISIPYLYNHYRRGNRRFVLKLLVYMVAVNALSLAIVFSSFLRTGRLFAFFESHTTYSRWFYNGYDVPVVEKLLYYPRLVASNMNPIFWLLVPLAIALIFREANRRQRLIPLVLALASLSTFSVLNVFSGPPSAAPGRYALFYLLLFAPYAAYGFIRILQAAWRSAGPIRGYAAAVVLAIMFIYSAISGVVRTLDYPEGMSRSSVETGAFLREMLDQVTDRRPANYLVEARYWDFLAVQLMAGHHESINFDREINARQRDLPSLFQMSVDSLNRELEASGIVFFAIYNDAFKEKINDNPQAILIRTIGPWSIYQYGAD